MSVIIRREALEHLPLRAEPLDAWGDDCDCHQFLRELFYDEEDRGDSREFGTFVFRDETEALLEQARSFSKAAKSARHMNDRKDPDLVRDPAFGLACKYMVAWDGVVSPFGVPFFFPWVHLLGLRADLECSLHLAGGMYYKHAMLALRELVERVTVPIFFADDPAAFAEWREGRLDTPSPRGESGLLAAIAREGRISGALADEAAELLGELDAYVHGSDDHWFSRGFFRDANRGVMFRAERLEMWARHFARSVDWAIRVTALYPEAYFKEEMDKEEEEEGDD